MILTLIEISWVKKNCCVVYPLKGWKRCRSQQRADNPVLTCQRILYKSCFTKEEEKNRCKLAQWRAPLLLFHPHPKNLEFSQSAGVCGKQGRESHRERQRSFAAPLAGAAVETRAHDLISWYSRPKVNRLNDSLNITKKSKTVTN